MNEDPTLYEMLGDLQGAWHRLALHIRDEFIEALLCIVRCVLWMSED